MKLKNLSDLTIGNVYRKGSGGYYVWRGSINGKQMVRHLGTQTYSDAVKIAEILIEKLLQDSN